MGFFSQIKAKCCLYPKNTGEKTTNEKTGKYLAAQHLLAHLNTILLVIFMLIWVCFSLLEFSRSFMDTNISLLLPGRGGDNT